MASTNSVIFPESMADILTNPVDICFGSMPTKSTALAACLVIEGNAVTSDQQIRTDRVEGMLSDTIKVCERVKRRPRPHHHPACLLACRTRLT
jgi:hypothetical protein